MKGLKRFVSIILVAGVVVTTLFLPGLGRVTEVTAGEGVGGDIIWNFEDGELAPFTLVSGSYGTVISDIPYDHHSEGAALYLREGKYHLSTYESAEYYTAEDAPEKYGDLGVKMTKPSGEIMCELYSPIFRLDDPKISFLIGGGTGSTGNTYVALCDIYGREIVRASGSGSEEMSRVEWDLTYEGVVDDYVFIKIVDGDTDDWGHVTFDDFHARGVIEPDMTVQTIIPEIHWSFENGALGDFKVVEGEFGAGIIASWDNERNSPNGKINKHGSFYLSTVETDTSSAYNESYTGTIVSPVFTITDPTVRMKLGGGTGPDNYVAIVRYSDGSELARYSLSALATYEHDKNGNGVIDSGETFSSGHMFSDVSLTIPENLFVEGEKVYIKIVDGTTRNWGFIAVDDIRAKGQLSNDNMVGKLEYTAIHWSFEDGTMYPFSTTDSFKMPNICSAEKDWNTSSVSMNKDGKYYMSTVGKQGAWDEAPTGELTSVRFFLDPSSPTVSFRIAGGANAANYVAICNAESGEILDKVSPPKSQHPFTQVSLTVSDYKEGTPLVIKVVDGTTKSWAFVHVDDFRFSGALEESNITYSPIVWSFEGGNILPFTTETEWAGGIISTYSGGSSAIPHGKYYINTVQCVPNAGSPYDESITGEFVSPEFMLDPDNPVITMSINGGVSGNYVAVCNAATGAELGRVTSAKNSWDFTNVSLNLAGKFVEGDKLVLKIVDGTTKSWAWIGVDNIRGRFYIPEDVNLTTVDKVMEAVGWTGEDFASLVAMIRDNMDTYSNDEYPEGEELLAQVEAMRNKLVRMAKNGVSEGSAELRDWIKDMETLETRVRTSNPVFGSGLIIFTVHHQYNKDHHNTHNMFPSYNGEISDNALYTPGGAIKVMNIKTGEVTTLIEDSDGVFRDLDVSYDSSKILVSYRESRDSTYNIVEYTLSDDRLSIVGTKQLTSLSTADDMDPMYMPSGNIVFSSTRDPKYVMCNRHIAANLYRMEADGANIVKITSSTLFERPTDVLPDGRILYDRWEYNDRDFGSAQGVWTVYEDGTKQDTYYGNNSPTGAVIEAKSIPGTQMIMATLSSTHDVSWGALAIIDRSEGVDGSAPIVMTWPASVKDKVGDPGEDKNSIDAYLGLSIKYEDPQPLNDKYFLASRTLSATNKKMGVFLLDVYGNETLLYEDTSGMSVFDATVIQSREKEIVTSERRNYNDEVGTFFVQDVYTGTHMKGVERGTVKTLRIVESVDKKYIAQSQQWGGEGQQNPGVNWHSFEVKRVIGEVPVYEDGSAYFEVPQDVFVYFQLLDEDGQMIQSMRSGTLVQSGERTGCVGCHEDRRTAPITTTGESTPMALKANVKNVPNPDYVEGSDLPKTIAVNTPDVPQKRVIDFETGEDILVDWNDPNYFKEYTDLPTTNFLTEVQPIFTNNCLQCHGYDNPAANLSLVPDKDVIFNAAYINLWVDRNKSGVLFENLVGAVGAGDSRFYSAMSWGSYNSPLVKKLYNDKTHSSLLTDAEKRRIAEWVDLNGTYYGDYTSNYSYNPGGRSPITAEERSAIGDMRTLNWSSMTLATLNSGIYFDNPEKSPILRGKTGAAYDEALRIIQTGLSRLRTNPDVDWAGLDSVPGNTLLKINPYKMNDMDEWRTEKVALYDAMEAANRAAIVKGEKLYDKDFEKKMREHNSKWPGWPTASKSGNKYTKLPD